MKINFLKKWKRRVWELRTELWKAQIEVRKSEKRHQDLFASNHNDCMCCSSRTINEEREEVLVTLKKAYDEDQTTILDLKIKLHHAVRLNQIINIESLKDQARFEKLLKQMGSIDEIEKRCAFVADHITRPQYTKSKEKTNGNKEQ